MTEGAVDESTTQAAFNTSLSSVTRVDVSGGDANDNEGKRPDAEERNEASLSSLGDIANLFTKNKRTSNESMKSLPQTTRNHTSIDLSQSRSSEFFSFAPAEARKMPSCLSEGSRIFYIWKQTNAIRLFCGNVVNNERVQLLIVLLIMLNAIMLGIGTFDFASKNASVVLAFEKTDKAFLIIFTIELGLQIFYHGWRLLLDGWLVFDLIIISVSWGFEEVQIIRAFRIFRTLRLVTRIKVMKNLIVALLSVMPRMAAIGLLLFLIFYIFAVMLTNLFGDFYQPGQPDSTDFDYFGRLDLTFFTLFQMMTLDNWADITRQCIQIDWWAWLPILSFVIISGFVVVNLIIAVICDAIAALNVDEKAKLEGNYDGSDGEEMICPTEVREKLDFLEEQVNGLSQMQKETKKVLKKLMHHLEKYEKDLTK